jgi:hypothetical protein
MNFIITQKTLVACFVVGAAVGAAFSVIVIHRENTKFREGYYTAIRHVKKHYKLIEKGS